MSLNVRTEQVGLEESIESVVRRINRRGLNVKIRSSDFTQPLGRITQKADEFTKSLEASNARVIAFGASAAIIGGVTKTFSELVLQAIKVEKVLTDINVVLGTTAQNLSKFGDNLFRVARNTAQTLEVAAEAALEFSRQGLSMEETLKRTNDALILTRLTGLKAADSVKGLTAAVNGFADAGLNTTQIINKLAAVDVKFAVGADDLINALARAGAVAQDAGVNFDQLVGAVTSAQQITARGGAVIGNSFKTIFTRIQRASTLDALEELGIAVRDIRGNTIPAISVLKSLSDSYNDLGASTKAAVAEQVGGVFQINVLKAALKDLNNENSLYSQATKISNQATDQAQRKNEQLQKTISALATQTNLTIQELAANMGELALSPGISKLLEAVNSFGEGLNSLFGKNSEGIGADLAKGILKGIGGVLTGPGVVLAFGVFGKLFANALKFAKSSLKDILGIVTLKDREKNIQEAIVSSMSQNKQLAIELNKYSGDKVKQEQIMLGIIKEQTKFLAQQQQIAATIAPGLARAGVNSSLTMSKNSKPKASGLIPNYASQNWQAGSSGGITPHERLKEQGMAIKSGYAPGAVKKMNISGLGDVVYNSNESVKMFPGMAQPAIMPPEGSRAGNSYGSAFKSKHGFNPYEQGSKNNSSYSSGFIPNYVASRQVGTMLNLPSAKMMIQHPKDRGWRRVESPLDNVATHAAKLKPMIDALKSQGVTALSRKFYFTNQDPRGRTSGGRKVSDLGRGFSNEVVGSIYEQGMYGNKQGSMKKKGFLRTSTDAYSIKGKKAIKKKGTGDSQAVVDFVRPGRLPIEAKHGYAPANILAKSIYQASDRSIENFLKTKNINSSSFRKTKEERALRTANSLRGFKGSTISDAENLGLYGGFVPNFADDKIQPVKSISNIIDGDSIEADVLVGTQRVDHRLHGVDAVEKDQAYGTRATSIAKNLYNNQKGKARLRDRRVQDGKAAYGRGLFKDQELARSLVAKGYGVPDAGYLNKGDYLKYQKIVEAAKSKGVGIWRDKTPKGRYRHPKAKFYLHQQGVVQKADKWKEVTVGSTRFKGKDNNNLSNKKHEGYADGGKKFRYFGLIPNFADFRTREQKIQAVLSDPANKGIKFNNKLRNARTFKTQARGGMFHSMYVESYLKTGNQSDLNYLVKVGYNKEELISLRRHKKNGGRVNVRAKGFVPNFLKTQEFSQTSRSASQFNSANGLDLQTALSGGRGFKLSKFNFDKVRQFLNSSQFRQLPENIQKQLLNKLKIQSKFVKMGDVTRPYLRGKTSFPGRIAASSGFIPNFSSPLEDAISREKAAGIPKSIMRVESDLSLVGPENPLGLGVTNKRDEPAGIKQGINRAKRMGINPKTHGSSNNATYASGLIPNFAEQSDNHIKARERAIADKKAASATNEATKATKDYTGRLFAITSLTYMLEGAFSDMEGQAGSATKSFIGLVQGISQGALVFEALGPISEGVGGKLKGWGEKLSSSGGKIGKGFGGLVGKVAGAAKALPLLGAAAAGIIPIWESLKENTTMFDSGLDTLRKSAEKTSKTIDALGTAITSAESVESTKKELTELNNSAMAGTFEGEMKRLKLNQQLIKEQASLAGQSGKLASQLDLTESEIKEMTSGTSKGMMELQKAVLSAEKSLASISAFKGLVAAEGGTGLFGKDADPITAVIQELNLASMVASSVKKEDLDKQYKSIFNAMSEPVYDEIQISTFDNIDGGTKRSLLDQDRAKLKSDVSKLDIDPVLKGQMGAAIDSKKSLQEIAKFLRKQLNTVKGKVGLLEEDEALTEADLAYGRETNKLKQSIANALEIRHKQADLDLQFSKKQQSMTADSVAFQVKYNESLGRLTGAKQVEEAMTAKTLQLQNDFNNTQQEITDKYSSEGTKFISSLFKKQGGLINPKLKQSVDEDGTSSPEVFKKSKGQLKKKLAKASNRLAGLDLPQVPEIQGSIGEFMKNLPEIKSGPRIEAEFEKLLTNIQDFDAQNETLIALQESGIIPKNRDIASEMERLSGLKQQESNNAKKINDEEIKNLDLVRKKLNMEKSTLSYNEKRLKDLQNTPRHELDAVFKDELKTSKSKADFAYKDLKNKEIYERDGEGLVLLQSEQLSEGLKAIGTEREITRAKRARLAAEEANLILQQEQARSIQEQVQLKNEGSPKRIRDSQTEAREKFVKNPTTGKNTFETNTEEKLNDLGIEATELAAQFASDRDSGVFVEEALNDMGQSARDFEEAMIKAKKKIAEGEFGKEGLREIAKNRVDMVGNMQKLQAQQGAYQSTGNSGRTAEVTLELAKARKELNFETGQGTLFADSLAVKIAEANVQMERFGETLANTTFDAVKDGFKGMLKDMGDSTKSVGDSILTFFGGIAGKIQEALVERAAAQITSGLFEMMGMDGMYNGGIVSRYASGGSTRSVPAMLTAGEVVVKKKVVDRLGKSSLDKINQSGSLEDLYNKPNEDNFEIFNSGGIVAPQIMRLKEGGSIDNYLAKRNKGEDRVSQNERSTVDGEIINNFTNTLAKFMGGIVRMNKGGWLEGSLSSSSTDSAGMKVAKGAGYLAGSSYAAYQDREEDENTGPTAPTAPKSLNTVSSLNIDPTSRQMSAQYRAKDQYSQDYGKYLLDKYQFDVDKKNTEVRERAAMIQNIGGAAALMGGMYLGKKGVEKYNDYKHNQNMKYVDNAYTQMHIDKGTASSVIENRAGSTSWADSRISDLSESSTTDISSLKNNTIYGDNTLSSDTRNFVNTPVSSTNQYNYSSSIAGGSNYNTLGGSNFETQNIGHEEINNFKNDSKNNFLTSSSSNLYSTQRRNQGGIINNSASSRYSYFNKGGSIISGPSNINSTHLNSTHPDRGGPEGSAYRNSNSIISNSSNTNSIYLNRGGHAYSSINSPTVNKMSEGGKVFGPNGIDKVGPVMLDRGEYVIKASSVNKVEKQYPGFFEKLNSSRMSEGGPVQSASTPSPSSTEIDSSNNSSSNITVNINVSSSGETSVDGGGADQQAMASRIKDAVVGVISQEKRVGGMLRGY